MGYARWSRLYFAAPDGLGHSSHEGARRNGYERFN